jgi:hypothetical protein
MKSFHARIHWQRNGQDDLDGRYSRAHGWHFDGGLTVPAWSSPLSVSVPMSDAAALAPAALHHEAHARCYIANSLRGEVVVEGFE